MNRREFLARTGAVAAAVTFQQVFASIATAQSSAKRPNILFILSDDHAVRAMSPYSDLIDTPNLMRIAREGATFERNFCADSLCGPSRANILTGKHTCQTHFYDNKAGSQFDGSQETYPKRLQAAGYQTAMIGKWHLHSDPTGFDHWEILDEQGQYYNPDFITPAGKKRVHGYVTEIITDKSIAWLEGRDPSKPFLLHCWHKAPHRPWMPNLDKLDLFKDKTFADPDNLFDDYANRASPAKGNHMSMGDMIPAYDLKLFGDSPESAELKRMTPEQKSRFMDGYKAENDAFHANPPTGKELIRWRFQRYLRDYLRCISSVDDNIGRVLKYLDDNGLADNTIVIYSSDQGFYLGEHGWFDKRWMYEESFSMPLLMKWPGVIKPGTKVNALTQSIDFAPTLLDAAGLKAPQEIQGVDLRPVLDGKTPADWRKSLYYHYYEWPNEHHVPPQYGVRDERYKLVYYPVTQEWELFDLQNDPHEMKSVYSDPAQAAKVAELKEELTRLRNLYQDTDQEKPARSKGR